MATTSYRLSTTRCGERVASSEAEEVVICLGDGAPVGGVGLL